MIGLDTNVLLGTTSSEQALSNCEAGIDFADALHHASYKTCESVATFDDRKLIA